MYIPARERRLLKLLLNEQDHLDVRELASSLDVSTRTIQRDLKGLGGVMSDYDLTLHKDVSNRYYIHGAQEHLTRLKVDLASLEPSEFTPEERQLLLLVALLEKQEPVKLFSLAEELNVTVATVSHDLTKVEEWLSSFHLTLIRRRGYGVEVAGSETNIRRSLSSLITENISEGKFYQSLGEDASADPNTESISERLLDIVDAKKIQRVQEAVENLRTHSNGQMADSSYIGLIVHLALAIERIQQGENVQMDEEQLRSLQQESVYELAKTLANSLESIFSIRIPEEEVGYIVMHLRGAKIQKETNLFTNETYTELSYFADRLIKQMEKQLDLVFDDDSLYPGLISHLEPAMYRMNHGMKIHNPLLARIKQNYASLYKKVKQVSEQVFESITVPEEEIGFLVMHFGSAIERQQQKNPLKAMVICSSGIGSSKLLASRLEKEFPEIEQIENVSLFDFNEREARFYDLIISTVPLTQSEQYFLVKPFLSKEETEQIRQHIKTLKKKRPIVSSVPQIKQSISVDHIPETFFEQLSILSHDIALVIDSFNLKKGKVMNESLAELCTNLEEGGALTDAVPVFEALLQRERLGGLGIPDTSLALFHTRTEEVLKPVFTMLELDVEESIASMGDKPVHVSRVILMLAPLQAHQSLLDLLSSLSVMLISSDEYTRIVETGTEAEIKKLISQHCFEYIQKLLLKGVH
ncbi:BglG family transcription antiterminator [Alkalicoccobacillus murimartini]|uniref:Mannitol operon transcriptional antiterminator n=1 Tax=Alkalicoccobacillus murimartini TaxID=171685 RepID=A0ABT9YFF6_9BACI|nr:BglG family transcription antiterminator [Alkalicoccobacillus murimartini]MDQ0206587.1 mannitol operon transcriptional antiterminator [Alkalicoccobacillus murimartini]